MCDLQGSVFSRLGGKSALKRPAPDDGTEDTHEGKSPLEYAGVLKFPKVAKQPKLMASKKVTVLDDTVMITTTEQAMATAAAKARKFTLSDVKPLKVQVTSTTPVQKAKVKPTPISVAIDELISAEKKTCKFCFPNLRFTFLCMNFLKTIHLEQHLENILLHKLSLNHSF